MQPKPLIIVCAMTSGVFMLGWVEIEISIRESDKLNSIWHYLLGSKIDFKYLWVLTNKIIYIFFLNMICLQWFFLQYNTIYNTHQLGVRAAKCVLSFYFQQISQKQKSSSYMMCVPDHLIRKTYDEYLDRYQRGWIFQNEDEANIKAKQKMIKINQFSHA